MIAGSYDKSVFHFVRNCRSVQGCCTVSFFTLKPVICLEFILFGSVRYDSSYSFLFGNPYIITLSYFLLIWNTTLRYYAYFYMYLALFLSFLFVALIHICSCLLPYDFIKGLSCVWMFGRLSLPHLFFSGVFLDILPSPMSLDKS